MRLPLLLGLAFWLIAGTASQLANATQIAVVGNAAVFWGSVRVGFYVGLAVGGCSYAILRGGGPERAAGIVVLVTLLVHPLLHLFLPATFVRVDPVHLFIDLVRFVAFMAIARDANRFWVICFAALQLLGLSTHLTKVMAWEMHPIAYQASNVIWDYGMLLLLILATSFHQRLLARGVTRRSWSVFSIQ